jgi:hypothetical protein
MGEVLMSPSYTSIPAFIIAASLEALFNDVPPLHPSRIVDPIQVDG